MAGLSPPGAKRTSGQGDGRPGSQLPAVHGAAVDGGVPPWGCVLRGGGGQWMKEGP